MQTRGRRRHIERVPAPGERAPDADLLHARIPVMLAYVAPDGRCVYHNEAFRRGFGLKSNAIEPRGLAALLGEHGYGEVAERVRDALSGRLVHHCSERAANGHPARAWFHFVPHFDAHGRVAGAYALVVDEEQITALQPADPADGVQELYEGRSNDSYEWRKAVARVREALRGGEFRLYRQTIEDLWTGDASFQGIFVRQAEEEQNRLPPGAFFAMAEEFHLLKELDRWVIERVLAHEAERRRDERSLSAMYCIHLSRDSIADPYFPDFVMDQLAAAQVPAEVLCFEVQECDAMALRSDSADMARQLRRAGVHVMLGGFGRDERAAQLLHEVPVDFVKIDGSLVLGVARSESALAGLRAIVREAHALGINAVAELAESSEVVARLREIEVDYAQGVAVSPALPLWERCRKRTST